MPNLRFNYHRQPSCATCEFAPKDGGVCICGHPKHCQVNAKGQGVAPIANWDGICDLHEPRETP